METGFDNNILVRFLAPQVLQFSVLCCLPFAYYLRLSPIYIQQVDLEYFLYSILLYPMWCTVELVVSVDAHLVDLKLVMLNLEACHGLETDFPGLDLVSSSRDLNLEP